MSNKNWLTHFANRFGLTRKNSAGAQTPRKAPHRTRLSVEQMEDRLAPAITVAVVTDGSGAYDGYNAVVNQLNDDTYFDFTATLVQPGNIATVAQLNAYDVVVMGGSLNTSDGQFGTFSTALRTWVEGGGGVVMTGWGEYAMQSIPSAARTDLNGILPIVLNGGWNYQYGPTVSPNANAHQVTQGVTSFSYSCSFRDFLYLSV